MSEISKAVGHKAKDIPVSWNKRDLLTYAVGIGAKANDLSLVYELGYGHDVNLFADRIAGGPVPGLPRMDPNRVVHATQSIEILKELPLVSGEGWKLTSRITGVVENKSGIIVTIEYLLVDPSGTPYAKLYSSTFNLGAKATGEKFSKFIAGPPQGKVPPKERKPDWMFKDQTSAEQAIIYRLSGDFNPLHIDPRIGKAAGFGGVILHGLSTLGFAARAVVNCVANGDPRALKFFGVRFTAPVKPGDGLETQIWEVGPGPNGTVEVTLVTKNTTTGKIVLGNGIAYIKKAEKSKM